MSRTPMTRSHNEQTTTAFMYARPPISPLTRTLAAAGLACAMFASAAASAQTVTPSRRKAAPSEASAIAELAKKLDALEKQNAALQAKVQKLEAAQTAQTAQAAQVQQQTAQVQQQVTQVQQQAARVQQQATQVQQQAQAVDKAQQDMAANASTTSASAGLAASTTVSAYGEIGYSHPTKSPSDTHVDAQRAVLGLQHRFDDRTKVIAEFEWEHAIASAGDRGDAEVEQLWIEREFANGLRGRAGLFLMPVGLVNPNHEPTAYHGVFRPDVDTKIVPSTWREVGAGLAGDTSYGLNWDVAITTMPNLSKWDPASIEGRDRGPLQSIHGEGQFAAARDLGGVAALNWRGVPGLLVGGSAVYGSIGQHQPGFLGNDSKLLLLDAHARYQIAGWDFAAEAIRGTISRTEALNSVYATTAVANPTLVPHLFYGGYVQAAYALWHKDDYTLLPFVRYEVLNTAAGFGGLSVAAGGVKQPDEKILTAGATFRIGEGIVLKADYRNYRRNKLPDAVDHFNLGNSINLGVGFAF